MEEKDSAPLLNEQEVSQMKRDDDFLPASIWVPASIWRVIKSAVLWIVGFIIDIFISLGKAGIALYNLVVKGSVAFWKGCKSLAHKFRYNDIWGRLSFILFGMSNFGHRRYVNGAIMLGFEIAYILLFALYGIPSIGQLSNLGDIKHSTSITDPETGIGQIMPADNSVLIIVYGILWIISIFFFLYVWKRSIDTGYKNYRISHYDDFTRRAVIAKPYSDLIDADIVDNALYEHPFKELKDRYSEVYAAASGKAGIDGQGNPDKMDVAYISYILDSTIVYRRDYHKRLSLLNEKIENLKAKVESIVQDAAANEKIAVLTAKAEEAKKAYSEAASALESASETEDQASYSQAKKALRSTRLKKILAENQLVSYKQSRTDKADKIRAKIRLLESKVEDMHKNDLSFSTIDSVENQSKYGKFNVYYRRLADMDRSILFYANYDKFVNAYNEGVATYAQANEQNAASREALTEENAKKLDAITEQYDSIEARRQSIVDERTAEKSRLAEAIAAIKADSSLSMEEAKEKIAEAKALCAYNLKTIKGKILALPSVKEVRAAKKEEILNVNRAYKRDYRGLKVDYTPEEYGVYMAANAMILQYGFDFAFAYEKAKKEIKEKILTAEESQAKLEKLQAERADYVSVTPTKFDGKPKTLAEQAKALFNENFHIFLLTLPIIGVIFFTIMPLILSILVAFTDFTDQKQPPTDGFSWILFDNFIRLFAGSGSTGSLAVGMGRTILWTFIWAIFATFTNYFLGIIMALLINKEGIKFKGFWRFMFMLSIAVPQFISLISMSLLLSNTGALSSLYQSITGSPLNFAVGHDSADVTRTKVIIILVNIWVGVPYTILQTSGILMNIPKDLYESSKIDGANAFVQFTKITLPYIFFVTGPSLIQTFIGNINNFGVIYFLTGGGATYDEPVFNRQLGETDLLVTYIYKVVTAVQHKDFGLASTIGIFVFIICAFISIVMYNRSSAVSGEDTFQ